MTQLLMGKWKGVLKNAKDLSKMESSHNPLTETLLTGAAISHKLHKGLLHSSSLIVGFVVFANVLPESSTSTCNI